MADEDNFDIDIYGDDDPTNDQVQQRNQPQTAEATVKYEAQDSAMNDATATASHDTIGGLSNDKQQDVGIASNTGMTVQSKKEDSTNHNSHEDYGDNDDRPVDAGGTEAVIIGEIQWWVNDDDIRGWARYCGAEDELRDITFSEHKVNGKCKGQVYVDFHSAQAATAFSQVLQSDAAVSITKPASKKYNVQYTNPTTNPFKTLPKDGPARHAASSAPANTNAGAMRGVASNSPYERQPGTQRGRGAFRGRGGYNNGMNGNFSGGGGFNRGGNMMGGFNRGGFQGSRGRGGFGGQGGMNGGMMGMPNMMGMGGMGGMPMMPNMMGMAGFNPMQAGNFNPGFFQGAQGTQGGDNPHGQKRMRQDG